MGNDASKQSVATQQRNGVTTPQTEEKEFSGRTVTMTTNGDVKRSDEEPCGGCQPDHVIELRLPASDFSHSAGISFDIGGSRCKVAIVQRENAGDSDKPADGLVKVVVLAYHRSKVKDALDYVRNNFAELSSADGSQTTEKRIIRACGWSVRHEARELIGRELHAEVRRIEEFPLLVNGFKCLLHALPDADLFYGDSPKVLARLQSLAGGFMQMMAAAHQQPQQQPSEPQTVGNSNDAANGNVPTDNKTEDLPYLLASVGSGSVFILVSPDGTHRYVQGTHQGGSVLTTFANLLIGTNDYKEVMELAEKGDESRVSVMCRDVRSGAGEKDFYDFMPEDVVVFPFGKLTEKKAEGARREDLAAALVEFFVGAIALDSFWIAVAHNCQTVYVSGGLFEHSFARDTFAAGFGMLGLLSGKMQMKCRLVKHTSVLPVIGALVDDQQLIQSTTF